MDCQVVKNMLRLRSLVVLVAFLSFSAPLSYADPVTIDLTGFSGVLDIGESISFTVDGITVTATAWGYTYDEPLDNALDEAALVQSGSGLGVCDESEFPCTSTYGPVDNVGPDNWILFTFSENVDPLSVNLYVNPLTYPDWDLAYRVGNIALPTDLTGLSYLNPDELTALGFEDWIFQPSGALTWPMTVSIGGNTSVNALLIGADLGSVAYGDYDDGFKLTSLTVERAPVPEPTSLLLLGAGLTLISGVSAYRRRHQK